MVYTLPSGMQMTRRMPLTLLGAASGALTDHQLKLTTAWNAIMQADFDDVRFVNDDFSALIDAWLESKTDSDTADIWVEFPSTPADGEEKKCWAYFGNDGVSSDWDIRATMIDGDDFSSALDTENDWTVLDVTTDVTDGILTLSNFTGATHRYCMGLMSKTQLSGSPLMIESKVKTVYAGDSMWFGMTNDDDLLGASVDLQLNGIYYNGQRYRYSKNDGTATEDVLGSYSADVYYRCGIKWISGASAEFYVDGVELGTAHTTNIANENMYLGFMGDSNNSPTIYCEWIFARKYAANPPTHEFGAEEHQRRTPMMM